MSEILFVLMLATTFVVLLSGYPVAFVLAAIPLIFAFIGSLLGVFDLNFISAITNRVYGIMNNDLLISIPLFVYMGVMLEKSKIAEELLNNMSGLLNIKSGLGISVMIVGCLLAASTGIVGATVVTMGMISLPVMLKSGYKKDLATGTICAAGTLGQIIPPSIVLILLGDQISNSYQISQLELGNLSPNPVTIADLFLGAIIPGFILVLAYIIWIYFAGPKETKKIRPKKILRSIIPPIFLIVIVLGSILTGFTTATESAAVGAIGAMLLAYSKKRLTIDNLKKTCFETGQVTTMIFTILIGAAFFTLVFRGFGGDEIVHNILSDLGGLNNAIIITMIVIFILGFFLDFIEIIYVVVPVIAPSLFLMGADPIWLAIMIAINLQTSFLTPPFGFALFYLKGAAPKEILCSDIYKGVIPFIAIQIVVLLLIAIFPDITTSLPNFFYEKPNAYIGGAIKDIDF